MRIRWQTAWPIATYLLAYVALDGLSYVQPLLKLGITPWNPQAGLTLAFLAWQGWRQAPWTAVAALAAEVVVRDPVAPWPAVVAGALAIAAGYGALAYVLGRRDLEFPIASRRDAAWLSLGGVVAALVVAVAYVAAYAASGVIPLHETGPAVARFWVGDINGILTLTPLLLGLGDLVRDSAIVARRWRLLAAQLATLGVTVWLVFGLRPGEDLQFVYVLFAPVVWITLTWGVLGASLSTLLIQIGLMNFAGYGLAQASVIEVQFLLVTLGLTALLLGAVVGERSRALRRVAASEAEQRALLAEAPDAVLSTDDAGRIVSANPAAQRLFGAEPAALLGTAVGDWLGELRLGGAGGRARVEARRADGARMPTEVAWVPLESPARAGHLLLVRDITEREQAQAQLRERDRALARAMRFALAGELASALTHELNQPITALVSYLRAVEILADRLEGADPRLVETVHKASREALRASDVLKRLRDFYRTGTAQVAGLDLAALVDEVAATFAARADRLGVDVRVDLGDVREGVGDRIQLQMVLYNLVANALDALADAPGPRRLAIVAAVDDAHLRIAVEDSGRGIPDEIAAQLFEPFVTSKPDGMGLGLAISRSLMRSQGGELRLEARRAGLTRFVVELPRAATGRAAA